MNWRNFEIQLNNIFVFVKECDCDSDCNKDDKENDKFLCEISVLVPNKQNIFADRILKKKYLLIESGNITEMTKGFNLMMNDGGTQMIELNNAKLIIPCKDKFYKCTKVLSYNNKPLKETQLSTDLYNKVFEFCKINYNN